MKKRRRAKALKTLPGLERSTVPGRITINLSGEIARAVNAMAERRATSKNSIAESFIREGLLNSSNRSNAVKAKEDVLRYSRVLIEALQDALDYNPNRHHNRPPPDLRVSDDENFLEELRSLIAELKRLNDLLEIKKKSVPATRKEVNSLGQHFDRFLSNYAAAFGKAAGKGTGYLLVAGISSLLYHAGIGKDLIDSIWRHIQLHR
jgi:hypothetical protein